MSRLVNRVVSSRPSFPALPSSSSSFHSSIRSSLSRPSLQPSRVFSSLASSCFSSSSSSSSSSWLRGNRCLLQRAVGVSSGLVVPDRSSLLKAAPSRSYYYTPMPHPNEVMHATTILAVRKGNNTCVIGDGQVSLGPTVVKTNARKVRVIGGGKVVCGFAGATADCFALLDRLEKKLEEYPGQLLRAAVEMAKEWRSDKYLRQLEAWMIACDATTAVTITGHGDVMSAPDDGCIAIGSGGLFAVSAARALVTVSKDHSLPLTARQIAERAMTIASEVCVYTNNNFVIEEIVDGVIQSGKDNKDASKSTSTTSSTTSSSTTTTTSSTSTPTATAFSSNFSTLV